MIPVPMTWILLCQSHGLLLDLAAAFVPSGRDSPPDDRLNLGTFDPIFFEYIANVLRNINVVASCWYVVSDLWRIILVVLANAKIPYKSAAGRMLDQE